MLEQIKKFKNELLEQIKNKKIKIISHHDTDGITSAAIMISMLKKLDKKFSVSIIKQFEKRMIKDLPEDKVLVLLDLGSSNVENFASLKTGVFIIDHHEISGKIPENVKIINPCLIDEEAISASGLTYLVAREIDNENKVLANLAVIGMIGDMLEKNLGKINNNILQDAEVVIKKGLLLYPATRPLNKALEFSSSIFIPGVTGNSRGATSFLRSIDLSYRIDGGYKSLIELNEEEMSKLLTAIFLRRTDRENDGLIGNIYLVKFFNRLEDARELSALLNACSRLEQSQTALSLCLGNVKARGAAERIYADYKQHIVAALNFVANMKKIQGQQYVIINAGSNIKDTLIGTVASILSNSNVYEAGTIVVTMAYSSDEKIKVSARVVGNSEETNIREILSNIIGAVGGECGGHPRAAGCLIEKKDEQNFVELLKKRLEIRVVKI